MEPPGEPNANVSLSLYIYIYIYISLSISLSLYISLSLSLSLPLSLYFSLSLSLYIYIYIHIYAGPPKGFPPTLSGALVGDGGSDIIGQTSPSTAAELESSFFLITRVI